MQLHNILLHFHTLFSIWFHILFSVKYNGLGLYAMRSKIYLPDNDTIINKVQETLSRLFKSDIDTPSTSQNTTPSNKSSKGNANINMINFIKVCRPKPNANVNQINITLMSYVIGNAKGDEKTNHVQPAHDAKKEDKIVEVYL